MPLCLGVRFSCTARALKDYHSVFLNGREALRAVENQLPFHCIWDSAIYMRPVRMQQKREPR